MGDHPRRALGTRRLAICAGSRRSPRGEARGQRTQGRQQITLLLSRQWRLMPTAVVLDSSCAGIARRKTLVNALTTRASIEKSASFEGDGLPSSPAMTTDGSVPTAGVGPARSETRAGGPWGALFGCLQPAAL